MVQFTVAVRVRLVGREREEGPVAAQPWLREEMMEDCLPLFQ